MEQAFKQVNDILTKLDEMHADHINSFDSQLLPDIEQQMIERDESFTELKATMDRLLGHMETMENLDDIPDIHDILAHIHLLMQQNKILSTAVQGHKQVLEKSMKKVAKGKHVINAYGSPLSQRNQPKVINFKK